MSSQSPIDRLVRSVDGMSLDAIADKYPNCHPEINPFDLYRAHLTNVLAGVTGVDHKIIYPSLAWTQSLDKGDLVLPAPALRIKGGKKPDELAKEWADKVGSPSVLLSAIPCPLPKVLTVLCRSFRKMIPSSRSQTSPTTLSPSSSGPLRLSKPLSQ